MPTINSEANIRSHCEHWRFVRRRNAAVDRAYRIAGLQPGIVRGSAFVNVLHYPARVPVGFRLMKSGPNRKTSRNPFHRLMKEPGVTGSEATDELVHTTLEHLSIVDSENLLPAVAREFRPPRAI